MALALGGQDQVRTAKEAVVTVRQTDVWQNDVIPERYVTYVFIRGHFRARPRDPARPLMGHYLFWPLEGSNVADWPVTSDASGTLAG